MNPQLLQALMQRLGGGQMPGAQASPLGQALMGMRGGQPPLPMTGMGGEGVGPHLGNALMARANLPNMPSGFGSILMGRKMQPDKANMKMPTSPIGGSPMLGA